MMRRRFSIGHIYFLRPIGLPGPIKIGFSGQPVSRLRSFMSWSPIPLELVATIPGSGALETNIHNCLALSHSHCEWFLPTDKVTRLVSALAAGTPIEQALNLSQVEGSVRSKFTRGVRRAWAKRGAVALDIPSAASTAPATETAS